jgi:hypothetical protein
MNKYLVLYQSEAALTGPGPAQMFANTPPEQMQAGMAAWGAWMQKCGAALLDAGAPLDHPQTVANGAATPAKSTTTGFSVLQANSMGEAVALVKDHPHFRAPGASVQVFEFVRMPGM